MTIMVIAILTRPPKWLTDFDQVFYLTIAYDLDRHRVFSNGPFDDVNSSVAAPAPGMFFAPVYPLLVLAASKIDRRFAKARRLRHRSQPQDARRRGCEVYARPMHLLHAAFLTLGVLAIALAAETIFASSLTFWLAGVLATLALMPETNLFSFVMTESVTFSLYSIAALALVRALQAPRLYNFTLVGCLFGLVCLTRTSFVVLALIVPGLIAFHGLRHSSGTRRSDPAAGLGICTRVAAPGRSLGRAQRRVCGQMGTDGGIRLHGADRALRLRRNELARVPAGIPVLPAGDRRACRETGFRPACHGPVRIHAPESFFQGGRRHREELIAAHGRLDPLIPR